MSLENTNAQNQLAFELEQLLTQLDIGEKIRLLGGQPSCGATFGCEKIGLPPLRMSDGPMGVHWWCSHAIAYPALVCAAAAWDPELWYSLGCALGRDCRARGVHILLAPGVNIYRSPLCGRNFEYCGEDPFLASKVCVGFIRGVQAQGVSCTVKHFAVNFQEYDRHHVSSDLDERTLHEIYLPAFKSAVLDAECGAVMTAYNPVNGVHCSQNEHLISDILKKDWGFEGVVMSDWTSTYDAVAAAKAGLDLEMPTAEQMNEANLSAALQNGDLDIEVINDKIRRILRLAQRFGWLHSQQHDACVGTSDAQNLDVALDVARSGIVLLKNDGNVLPLVRNSLTKVAVLGPNAHPAVFSGGGSAHTNVSRSVSVLEGLIDALCGQASVTYAAGPELDPHREIFDTCSFESELGNGLRAEYFVGDTLADVPTLVSLDQKLNFRWGPSTPFVQSSSDQFCVRWTGTARTKHTGEHIIYSKGYDNAYRIWFDDMLLVDSWDRELHGVCENRVHLSSDRAYPVKIEWLKTKYWSGMQFGVSPADRPVSSLEDCMARASEADAAIVCVGFNESTEGEGFDRTFGLTQGSERLIMSVAGVQKNTIVVVNAGGGVDMRAWIDSIPGLIYAFYPGQEGGRAIAEIILGDHCPSGKLPMTIERNPEDRSSHNCYHPPDSAKRVQLSDGLIVGYRHFDQYQIDPLFPFGFGLSYTQFEFGNISLSALEISPSENLEVSFDVSNVGSRSGSEVVQLYVRDVESSYARPKKELKAFAKVSLEPGEIRRVCLVLDRRALHYYDPRINKFVVEPGQFEVLVGNSAAFTPLCAEFTVADAVG
jgi:beta-glucosidase